MPDGGEDVTFARNLAYLSNGFAGFAVLRPLRDKVSAAVSTTGGSLVSSSGDAVIAFPSGAFTQTVNLTYRQLFYDQDTEPLSGIGLIFDLTAVYSGTSQVAQLLPGVSYTMTISYTDTALVFEDTLALFSWEVDHWAKEPSSMVNVELDYVTATPAHLSLWALLGETNKGYLPILRH